MPRIRFLKEYVIHGAAGPIGHESRLSFAAGETISVTDESADHFLRRQAAEFVGDAVANVIPQPEPQAVPDAPPADDDGDSDDDDDEAPLPKRRGRPPKPKF